MRGKNPGRWVQLTDGRTGILYNKDAGVLINGKLPVYVAEIVKQGDLFKGQEAPLTVNDFQASRILVNPEELKVIGFFD